MFDRDNIVKEIKLSDKFDSIDKITKALTDYYLSTEIDVRLIDKKGDVVISAGKDNAYCNLCAKIKELLPDMPSCSKTYLYGSYEAQRFGGKYIFFCPMGLTHWSSPILYDGTLIGSLIAGPVLMVEEDEYLDIDLSTRVKLDKKTASEVRESLSHIKYIEPQKITGLSELLFYTTYYLCEGDNREYWESRENQKNLSSVSEYLHYIKSMGNDGLGDSYPLEKERELLKYIADGDKDSSRELLNEILGYILFKSGGNFEVIKSRVLELVVVLSRAAMEGGGDAELIFGWNFKYIKEINSLKTFEELTYWLSRIMDRFSEVVFNYADIKHVDVIYKAINYIKKKYMEKITLEEVAGYAYLSPSYFSKIFKEEMGTNFNSYLNKVRIEKSKNLLLNDSISLVDVSNMVGYEDQSYFSKVFKKIVGMTPGKYRETRGKIIK